MVDYFSILVRAVAELNPNSGERRRVLYERARKALAEKFRAGAPQLSDTDLRAESAALEAAIRRIEADYARRAAASQPNPADATYDMPAEAYQDRPPLKDTRKRLGIVAGAFGVLIVLLAGAAVYSYWPRVLPATRTLLYSQRTAKPAEQAAADKNYIYMRQIVYYRTNYPVGTIVVDKSQTFLYLVRPKLAALRYTIGVGPECTKLVGLYHVVRKEEWPGWSAQSQQSPAVASDRKTSPLGARALDLNQDYRIHGTGVTPTNAPRAIERCIALANGDVIDLYDRTPLGSRVVVLPQ
jgi:lipoprotein-anchoring transpeptidase ErfK/SrfK